ncbi:30S ribosomal protein S17e [Methanocalculus chunghsingensis]|uniref:Small ribosomal subunit protein eS17 n=1 Tax=Methanocalculus chunghsingensis TaxID=156457 RepID=A0A8J7WAR2_9EURY|nr:30S ribosomal protein S17e [Methanocalculus chunghsingensis]MBR1369765.1 30S ribosomal protein S17e [Methanocalculus chunghsingensis]
MGIKPSYIKSIGTGLLEKHETYFSNDYDDNKHAVSNLTTIESKDVRNRVAGYITRKVNTRRRR